MQQDDFDRPGESKLTPSIPAKKTPQEPGEIHDEGEAGPTLTPSDPAQIIAEAIQRHVPTASSDQAEAAAKDALGRLKKDRK
jgi:hypothetical protein